jgi:hypothetical protein
MKATAVLRRRRLRLDIEEYFPLVGLARDPDGGVLLWCTSAIKPLMAGRLL